MPEDVELTLRKITDRRNLEDSNFLRLYKALSTGKALSDKEYIDILRFGILMSRSEDEAVQRLGYRIFLQYGESTQDYEPLREIAQFRELFPMVAAIDRLHPDLTVADSFESIMFDAHSTNFRDESDGRIVYRTRGQMELMSFNAREAEAIVVAPTSYGKSEMLVKRIVSNLGGRTCVVVPSRALIAQTRKNILSNAMVRETRTRVISHPDAYVGDHSFVAVMTQERLQRLMLENAELQLDQVLIDEAQNLLASGNRAIDLSSSILIARSRNPSLSIVYYTPFIAKPENIRHIQDFDSNIEARTVNEHVKIERYIIATPGEAPRLYDQFLNQTFLLDGEVPSDEVKAVRHLGARRNLVYVNRPRDAQDLAARLCSELPEHELSSRAERAIEAIADLIDPNYTLIECIRHGILFHHGQIPDSLRLYIEDLFRNDPNSHSRFLVTTSTLLEGVNTPADRLILMTGSRGRSNLSASAFRNLAGRVGRFRELFSPHQPNLNLLQPRICLLPSSYARSGWKPEKFLKSIAKVSLVVKDQVENPLLESSGNVSDRDSALEYLENVEPGAIESTGMHRASTEVGSLCYRYGVRDFVISDYEVELQLRVDRLKAHSGYIMDVSELFEAIVSTFFVGIDISGSEDLVRLRDAEAARRFYVMFLLWRTRNESFKRMIGHMVGYWSSLSDDYVYVGSKWGELVLDGYLKLFVNVKEKSHAELVNLAVVKIKEEQDFVDFRLMKYIEILRSLDLVDDGLYFRLKYGTDDSYLLSLLRAGFSPELAQIVKTEYASHVTVSASDNSVSVRQSLTRALASGGVNEILVYEAESLVNL
jgi:hypothetical protein